MHDHGSLLLFATELVMFLSSMMVNRAGDGILLCAKVRILSTIPSWRCRWRQVCVPGESPVLDVGFKHEAIRVASVLKVSYTKRT